MQSKPDIDVSFSSVSKRYLIRQNVETVPNTRRRSQWAAKLRRGLEPRHEFWAVKNVSFTVNHGESIGIIGHNGAGKSTILKMLSGITAPTQGRISIRGRFLALLEVGSGFHPELTGRENVYLSGSILGMRRDEIRKKLDSIVEFAGVHRFIDMPVKRYSSGMYVRLGFSIAAHLDPDVLLLDEVLAVGDRAFRDKCKERIGELHANGTTLLFISHDLTAVEKLCQRVLLLERGEIVAEGEPQAVIRRYTQTTNLSDRGSADHDSKPVQITNVGFFNQSGERCAGFQTGFPMTARIDYVAREEIQGAALSLVFSWTDGGTAAQWSTLREGQSFVIRPGKASIEFSCRELGLQPSIYKIDAQIEQAATQRILELQLACTSIHVQAGKQVRGYFYNPHTWRELPPELDTVRFGTPVPFPE